MADKPFKPTSRMIKSLGITFNIFALGTMVVIYAHHILYVVPMTIRPLENFDDFSLSTLWDRTNWDFYYDFRLFMEYLAIAFSLYVLLGNYILAVFIDPGISDNCSYKLTDDSFKLLLKKCNESNDFKSITDARTYNPDLDLSDATIDTFKDSFKYSLYCDKCNNYRYPRTHHWSVCKWCVYFMDHHCIWVNNCIGYKNRRYFSTLLFAWAISCLYYWYYAFPMYYQFMRKNFYAYHSYRMWEIDF